MIRVPALLLLTALMLLPTAGLAPADDPKPKPPSPRPAPAAAAAAAAPAAAEPTQRILYHARALPAQQLASALTEHFGGRIQAVPAGQMVLFNAPAALILDVTRTLEALDRPPAQVEIEVVLAEVRPEPGAADGGDLAAPADRLLQSVPAWRKAGRLVSFRQVRLTTLEDQAASVQTGDSRPFVTGSSRGFGRGGDGGPGGGFGMQSISYREVGVVVKAIPRLQGDQVLLDLQIEDAGVRPPEAAPAAAAPLRAAGVPAFPGAAGGAGAAPAADDGPRPPGPEFTTSRTKSVVRATPGRPVLVSGFRNDTRPRDSESLVIVTARILAPAPARDR